MEEWIIMLKRHSDFWEDTLTVTDEESGDPVPFTDASLIIQPEQGASVTWSIAGDQITMPSDGVINFYVPAATIAGYGWDTASYRLRVVYTNGRVNGALIRGLMKIED